MSKTIVFTFKTVHLSQELRYLFIGSRTRAQLKFKTSPVARARKMVFYKKKKKIICVVLMYAAQGR